MFCRSTIRGLILRVNNNYNLYNRFYQQPLPLTKNLSYHVNSKDVIIKPDRSDRSLLCLKFYSTGQHFTKDGEETVKERDRTSTSKTKQWNEKLATHSEAVILPLLCPPRAMIMKKMYH
ncbi:hypothetical protein BY996DRAFT_793548 [Phakopsora pachyrhizi]|nr:hypothetical protein BY996DRAFT_793548 [Phakopsora pachyrhizi]